MWPLLRDSKGWEKKYDIKMKKIVLYISFIIIALGSCTERKSKVKYFKTSFVNDVLLPTTPVKDQGRSPLCWIYAMLATIETNHIAAGDSLNLSVDYAARMWLADRTQHHYLAADGRQISMRGMMTMVPHVMERYGMMTYDSYSNGTPLNYNVLTRRMTLMADRSRSLSDVNDESERLLDEHIGYLPPAVHLYGATYTPQEFAHSLCREGDYVALTSFTHHPFGSRFVLETADNMMSDTFLNVPLDSLMSIITSSLRAGHAVCWEGDTSEKGFNFHGGTATMPDGYPCTQSSRQRDYERRLTTDDHCMALIGMAHDRHGRRFFIAKNSWGTKNPYGGLMYISEEYVRMKTVAVMTKSF